MLRPSVWLGLTSPWNAERVLLVSATEAVRLIREDGYQAVPLHRALALAESAATRDTSTLRRFVGRVQHGGYLLSDLDNAAVMRILHARVRSGALVAVRAGDDGDRGESAGEIQQRKLVREIEAVSRRRLNHGGRSYRLVVGSSLGRLPDRDSYEVVSQRDSVTVLRTLAGENASGAAQLAKLLSQAVGLVSKDWRPPLSPDGLVLLRRIIVQHAFNADPGPALSPSQLKKLGQSDWIEVELVDQDGEPYAMAYRIELPNGDARTGAFDEDGLAGVYEIESGTCKLTLVPNVAGPAADDAAQDVGTAEASPATPEDGPEATHDVPVGLSEANAPVQEDEATTWFEVTVLGTGGVAIAGVDVVFSVANQEISATTDDSGRARVDGPAGANGSARFADCDSVRQKVREASTEGTTQETASAGPDVVKMALAKNLPPFSVAAEKALTLVLVPFVARVRLVGMFFDHGKSFLLPSAMKGIRKLKSLYDEHPGATVVVTGHTDTKHSGPDQAAERYNLDLSDDRAKAVLAFLSDDVEAWYAWYEVPVDQEKHWGTPEDKYLLGALPADADPKYLRPGVTLDQAVRAFQTDHGLAVDGDPGPNTRRALIEDYMGQDETTLPGDVDATTYACGWYFLDTPTGPNVDEPRNRRVEIFLFDGPVTPPYPGPQAQPASPEYPAWKTLVTETHDFSTEDQPDTADCQVFYELHAYDTDEPMAGQAYTLTAPGQTRSGTTDAQGVVRELSLDPDDYLLEVAGVRMHVNAFSSQESQRRLTVLADPA
jgi:outer membrane protein OmpA-like peptidoglycan-associated protein